MKINGVKLGNKDMNVIWLKSKGTGVMVSHFVDKINGYLAPH